MAGFGVKYPVAAPLTEHEDTRTLEYGDGMVIGHAINESVSWTINNSPLYADNRIIENRRALAGGTVTVNTDRLYIDARPMLLGHEKNIIKIGDIELENVTVRGDSMNPYVGHGFYGTDVEDGAAVFLAVWIYKVQFSEPNLTRQTDTESTSWQTPTIEGTVMEPVTGVMLDYLWCKMEQQAIDWLNEKANIAAPTEPEPEP